MFLFSGCIFKTNVVSLDSYKPEFYSVPNEKSFQKAYVKSIIDVRVQENIIGKIKTKDQIHPLYTEDNIKIWLYRALEKGLRARGQTLIQKPLREAVKIKVAIIDFRIIYDESQEDYSTLKGYADLQLSLTKGWKEDVRNIRHKKRGLYDSPPSQSELEDFVQNLLHDITKDIVQRSVSL